MTRKELRAIRKSWGMTQKEFAKFLTYDEQQVSKMERGIVKIPQIIEELIIREQKLRAVGGILASQEISLD